MDSPDLKPTAPLNPKTHSSLWYSPKPQSPLNPQLRLCLLELRVEDDRRSGLALRYFMGLS